MLRLYLDDGGSQDNSEKPVFVVAGYIAPVMAWDWLTEHWQWVLNDLGAPPYHATDCEPGGNGYGHGDFETWDSARLLELKKRLAPLTYVLRAGVGRGLMVPDHNKHLRSDTFFINRVEGSREYLPVFLLVECVLDWIASVWPDRPKEEKISVVFEAGTRGIALAATVYQWICKNMTWASDVYTGRLDFGCKNDPPMQAADMLAFETYKDLEGRSIQPQRPERKMLARLRKYGGLDIRHAGPDDFWKIRDAYLAWNEYRRSEGIL